MRRLRDVEELPAPEPAGLLDTVVSADADDDIGPDDGVPPPIATR